MGCTGVRSSAGLTGFAVGRAIPLACRGRGRAWPCRGLRRHPQSSACRYLACRKPAHRNVEPGGASRIPCSGVARTSSLPSPRSCWSAKLAKCGWPGSRARRDRRVQAAVPAFRPESGARYRPAVRPAARDSTDRVRGLRRTSLARRSSWDNRGMLEDVLGAACTRLRSPMGR